MYNIVFLPILTIYVYKPLILKVLHSQGYRRGTFMLTHSFNNMCTMRIFSLSLLYTIYKYIYIYIYIHIYYLFLSLSYTWLHPRRLILNASIPKSPCSIKNTQTYTVVFVKVASEIVVSWSQKIVFIILILL
jgi:hypothetical protein